MRQQIHKIFKLQYPQVVLGVGDPYVLAVDRYKRDQYNLQLTPEVAELFDEGVYVIYVRAFMDQKGNLNIVEKVEKPRDWR
jgi:hypothetical protein